jgi:hypothetical protein
MNKWATEPFALHRDRVRRLLAQEFVWRMASIGSATLEEMRAFPLLLFKVPACAGEIAQVAEVARRLGWVEAPELEGGEWRLTDAGRAVPRPPSLAITQVVTRILSVADPVRSRATDWLPLVALVAGVFTAGVAEASTVDAVRWLAAAVLLASLLWQGYGEIQIVRAVRGWGRVQADPDYLPVARLYDWFRLVFIIVFDAAIVAAFTASLFGSWEEAAVLATVAVATGLVHLGVWTWPVYQMTTKVRDGRLLPTCPDAERQPARAPAHA